MPKRKAKNTKLATWPSPHDYNEAIQNLESNIADRELASGSVHLNALGLPRPLTGAFASVYKVSCPKTNYAVRCFLRDTTDQNERYAAISNFVRNDSLPYTVRFDFLTHGIRTAGRFVPVLKMDWVEGLNLDEYIEENIGTSKIGKLADSFLKMCSDLQEAGIAHGDLQHGNIIVLPSDELRLVDYDGMYVPSMKKLKSAELGHRNYQHPARSASDFDANLDRFSAWVIYASLEALRIDPSLFDELGCGDECLLFRRDDFLDPQHSYTFARLEHHANVRIGKLAKLVRSICMGSIKDVPPVSNDLASVLEQTDLPALLTPDSRQEHRHNQEPQLNGKHPDFQNVRCNGAVKSGQSVSPASWSHSATNLPDWLKDSISDLKKPVAPPRRSGRQQASPLPTPIEPELSGPLPRYVKARGDRMPPWKQQLLILFNPVSLGFWASLASPDHAAMAACVLFILAVMSAFVWYSPMKHKRLTRSGHTAVANVRRISSNLIEYEFNSGLIGLIRTKSLVPFEVAHQYEIAKQDTVLFDPNDPSDNILYVLSRYQAINTPPVSALAGRIEDELLQPCPRAIDGFPTSHVSEAVFSLLIFMGFAMFSVLHWVSGNYVTSIALGFLPIIFSFFVIELLAKKVHDAKLVQFGLPTIGRITTAGPVGSPDDLSCVVTYEFTDMNGNFHFKDVRISRDDLSKISAGAKATVLYNPLKPELNVLYCLSGAKACTKSKMLKP